MNKIFTSILVLFVFLNEINAQTLEVERQMSLGIQNGIQVSLPTFEDKYIEKVWKKYTKEFGKFEKNKKTDEILVVKAKIASIRGDEMDIYSSISDGQIISYFFIKSGFLNSKDHPKEFESAKNFMTEFGYEVQREKVREELDDENDKLKKSTRGLEKLKKENLSYHKDIEEAKAKIKKAEENIIENEKNQIKAQAEIETQTKVVAKVQDKLNSIGKSK